MTPSDGLDAVWLDQVDGKTVRHETSPEAPLWLDWTAQFLSLLPIEDQL